MSGKPNPNGVAQVREAALRVRQIDTEADQLRALVKTTGERLEALRYERGQCASTVLKGLAAMDVAANGNYGWESRVVWFLAELTAQAERDGVVVGPSGAAPERDAHRGGSSYEASMLRNLLARIHQDNGFYVEQHGLEEALESAEAKVAAWVAITPASPASFDTKALELARRIVFISEPNAGQRQAAVQSVVLEGLQWAAAGSPT